MNMIICAATALIWLTTPLDSSWNNRQNWQPTGPPRADDAVVFATSEQRSLIIYQLAEVGDMMFLDRYAYRITVSPQSELILYGSISSGPTPEILVQPGLGLLPGRLIVRENGRLGASRVILKGASGANPGQLLFSGYAGTASIYVNAGSQLILQDSADAEGALILSKPGSQGMFGGQIYVQDDAKLDTARVILSGVNSYLQMQNHNGPVTVGRLSGQGTIKPGDNELIVRNTDFWGRIEGNTQFTDRLDVKSGRSMTITRNVILGGALVIHLPSKYEMPFTCTLFNAEGAKSGAFSNVRIDGMPAGSTYKVGFVGNSYILTIQ